MYSSRGSAQMRAVGPDSTIRPDRMTDAVITCGSLQVWPGAANVIPGRASLTLDWGSAGWTCPRGPGTTRRTWRTWGRVGMIFVPSRGGRSHATDEYTSFDAIAAGADVLLATLLKLARGDRP